MLLLLPPETAKIFCQGLSDVVDWNEDISQEAAGLKLKDGASFYSGSDFANQKGLGFDFFVGYAGTGWDSGWLECYLTEKQQKFSENYPTPPSNASTGPRT